MIKVDHPNRLWDLIIACAPELIRATVDIHKKHKEKKKTDKPKTEFEAYVQRQR